MRGEVSEMLAFYLLTCPGGETRLLTGDMLKLEEMLPRNVAVRRFVAEQKLELSTPEQVQRFLAALKVLDEEMLDGEPYPLSAAHQEFGVRTEAELVKELTELLEGSLLAVARGVTT